MKRQREAELEKMLLKRDLTFMLSQQGASNSQALVNESEQHVILGGKKLDFKMTHSCFWLLDSTDNIKTESEMRFLDN